MSFDTLAMRVLRQRIGMKQNELAERIGTTSDYVSKIERGQSNPSRAMIARVARALGVSQEKLTHSRGQNVSMALPAEPTSEERELLRSFRVLQSPALRARVLGFVAGLAANEDISAAKFAGLLRQNLATADAIEDDSDTLPRHPRGQASA